MILGLLAERGPMHGHQIRRTAELTNAEVWGGMTGGALYAELRKLDGEGLVQAVREEQVAGVPPGRCMRSPRKAPGTGGPAGHRLGGHLRVS